MKTTDFDYTLPQELIAQTPVEHRDHSRLMVLCRSDGSIQHRRFFELPEYLKAGDVLVFNDTRVIRARLFARRIDSGGEAEILLLQRLKPNIWETLVGSKKKVKAGTRLELDGGVTAEVQELRDGGIRVISFSDESVLPRLGKVPLPPYIHTPLSDPERYQTVFAEKEGSVAAPTAGLHFTPELLDKIKDKGVKCLFVTLHIGLNTFRPIREEDPLEHPIYPEYGVISQEVAREITQARVERRRIICVGTTTVRLLEEAVQADGTVSPFEGWVKLFILPGYQFKVTDAMITNFHLPKSTLLMLVSAFAGKELIGRAYREAIAHQYRFYSFGDAMLIF
ncbi:MAG: tRNA preQ1(34) S-adenosylmethionine ribosyltransferase-isomerase QueA [Dehalococcoidia bacterium]|nr:tRNA preQ1(34) S-adenosylmethionine ribosyltransferase-isomerase QueA [Dehalococcoidia bacterium]